MKERRPQTHSQVHGRHLVLLHQGGDVAQEGEQRLQDLPVLVRHQQDGRSDGLQPLLLRDVWREEGMRRRKRKGHIYKIIILERCYVLISGRLDRDQKCRETQSINLTVVSFLYLQ